MSDFKNNIFELLSDRAEGSSGSEPAIHWEGRTLAWDAVEKAAREVAGGLVKMGVEAGDRVAVMLPNVPPYLFLQYATHLIGAIFVPIHELTRKQELGYILEDSEAKFFFAWGDYKETVQEATEQTESLLQTIEVGSSKSAPYEIISWMEDAEPYDGDPINGDDDIALIRYTAGVTGRPKGAQISHTNIQYAAEETDHVLRIFEEDTVFGAMPFYHPFGSTIQLQMLLPAGASLCMHTSFDVNHALEDIRAKKVSIFIGLPMHFAALVEAAGDEENIGKLRFAVSGGGPLDMLVMTRFERIFHTHVATIYGTCETSPTIAVNPSHREETPRDALGRTISGTDVKIVDESNNEVPIGEVGEILVKGLGLFQGYWNRPNATALSVDAEGWLHTADLGKMDIDGWLFGVGRLEDRINKGGFSVYPREIEQVINAHPSVHMSAVVGAPDRYLGEEIAAYVVLKSGYQVNSQEIIDYCTEQLARYKAPRIVKVVDSLPRSANGSVLRRTLREVL